MEVIIWMALGSHVFSIFFFFLTLLLLNNYFPFFRICVGRVKQQCPETIRLIAKWLDQAAWSGKWGNAALVIGRAINCKCRGIKRKKTKGVAGFRSCDLPIKRLMH